MLAGATITGFLMAVMMANAGGAQDNARSTLKVVFMEVKVPLLTLPRLTVIQLVTLQRYLRTCYEYLN